MKAKFLALAALVLGLASCQTDPEVVNPTVDAEVDFQLSVAAPELATRAGTEGAADDQSAMDSAYGAIDYLQGAPEGDYRQDWSDVNLRYTLEVYDKADNYADAKPVKDRQVIIVDQYQPVVFDLRLVPNREYHFVVFADFVAQSVTNETHTSAIEDQRHIGIRHDIGATLADITVKNDAINDEVADSYFATKDITVTNSAAQDIVLRRPYGKVRVVATDLAELNLNVDPKAVKVTYTAKHPQTFNAVTGAIGATEDTNYEFTYEYAAISKKSLASHCYTAGYDDIQKYGTTNANGEVRHTHMTLFTDYILALPKGQTPIHFTMQVYDDAEMTSLIKETAFTTDIPVERNKLTTVIGNVLTTATEIEVRIDDNFDGNYQYQLWDGKSIEEPAIEGEFYVIYEASQLAWLADQVNNKGQKFNGKTFKLGKDLHLNHERWTPIGATGKFEGTFDGEYKDVRHKIEGIFVDAKGKENAALFANAKEIKNLTVLNSQIYGQYKTAVILANGVCSRIENCHVDRCEVVSTPYNKDEANNVGGIVGYLSGESVGYVKNCSVINTSITAYRKVGGIVGAANQTAEVSGNRVENINVVADMTAEYNGVKAADAGAIVGYKHANAKVTNNTIGKDASVTVLIDTNQERDESYIAKDEVVHVTFKAGEYGFSQALNVNGSIQAKLGGTVTLNANGQTITSGTSADYGFISDGERNTLVINDANFVSNGGGIAAANGAKVIFNGNSVAVNTTNTSGRYNVYTASGGEVIINGGTFTFNKKDGRRAYVYANPGTRVVINGGTFGKASTRSGYNAGIMGDGEVIINAGTFGFDPTRWVGEDSLVEKVGDTWVVTAARTIYSTEQLQAALTTEYVEGQTLYLVNGDYVGHFDFSGKTLTLKGTNGDDYIKGSVWADNCNVTFQDVHFTNPDGVQHPNPTNSQYYNTINNQYPLIGAYNNAKIKFVNCTFHITGPTVYGYYGYAHNDPVFEDCLFECNGIRPIANNGDSLTITGCTFKNAYHYAARIFENAGERQAVVFTNNTMTGSNTKGEFEGINISKKGSTATVYADFTISGNTDSLKYRYHEKVTLDASCKGAEIFEQEQ